MNNFLKIFLLFITIDCVNAGYGIITTLEAPIVRDVTIDAPTILTARKGDKIYIHDKYFINGPLDVVYRENDQQTSDDLKDLETEEGYEKFYETIDKNGQTAYISRYYVKLITADIREFSQAVTPFRPDPNDYRISEPLPENYPIVSPNNYRAKLSFFVGPDLKSNYNYDSVLSEEDFTNRYGFDISYGRKAAWDDENRFYFGGILQAWTSQARFTLFDDRKATENRSQVGIGPYVSYDPWRFQNVRLTLQGSIMLNLTRNLIKQQDTIGSDEERLFKGISLSPRLSSFFQMKTETLGVDIVGGMDIQFYLPQNLTSSTQPQTAFWNEYGSNQDSVYIPFTAHWSLFVGVQTNY
ncbi:MAG: hypothetical protein K9K67_00530 [Bacteriovoracaceae bacterium]|nr:hypothetical protein [Bacteriovoracaceae bacterium]